MSQAMFYFMSYVGRARCSAVAYALLDTPYAASADYAFLMSRHTRHYATIRR